MPSVISHLMLLKLNNSHDINKFQHLLKKIEYIFPILQEKNLKIKFITSISLGGTHIPCLPCAVVAHQVFCSRSDTVVWSLLFTNVVNPDLVQRLSRCFQRKHQSQDLEYWNLDHRNEPTSIPLGTILQMRDQCPSQSFLEDPIEQVLLATIHWVFTSNPAVMNSPAMSI